MCNDILSSHFIVLSPFGVKHIYGIDFMIKDHEIWTEMR